MLFRSTPTYVLTRFEVNESATSGNHLEIHARAPGLIAVLLSLLNLTPTASLRLDAQTLWLNQSSFSGSRETIIPLDALVDVTTGFAKPVHHLFLAFLCVILIPATMFISLLFAFIFLILYFLKKSLIVSVVTHAGTPHEIKVYPNALAGISVGLEQIHQVGRLISSLAANARNTANKVPPALPLH